METNIRKCVEALEKLEKKFSYREIETAIYIYARLGEKAAEEKIFDLKVEKDNILKEIKQETENLKEFYKKYIMEAK